MNFCRRDHLSILLKHLEMHAVWVTNSLDSGGIIPMCSCRWVIMLIVEYKYRLS